MGSQTTYNAETDRAIVNGHHTDAVLQQLIHKYIESFVLCPNCRLPETEYKIKSGVIFHKCAACGAKEMVDMTHKLCTYIIAQDKKAKADAKKEGKKKDKKKEKKDGNSDDGDEDEKKKVRLPYQLVSHTSITSWTQPIAADLFIYRIIFTGKEGEEIEG